MGMTRQYLEQLSETIGPRPVASDTERDAAEWIRQRFTEHGLNTTIQDFDSIRSLSGAHLLYALISVGSVALMGPAHKWPALCWALWVLILLSAILAWLDFSGHGSLSRTFPKGPSQNVIGRYVPLAHPGEELTKVVLVAHYDSDRSTPLSSDSIAPFGRLVTKVAHAIIMVLPLFALIVPVPLTFLKKLAPRLYPYSWYGLMVISIPVLILLLNLLIAALVKRYSPGANNNASGVAALLSICEDMAEGASPTSSAASTEEAGKFGTGTLGMTGAFGAASMTSAQSSAIQQEGIAEEEGSDFDTTFDFGVTPQKSRKSRKSSSASGSYPSGSATPSHAEKVVGTYGNYDEYDAHETFADTGAQKPIPTEADASSRHPFSATTDFGFSADAADAGAEREEDSDEGSGMVLGADVIAGSAGAIDQFTESFGAVNASVATNEGASDTETSPDEFAAYAAGVSSGTITRGGEKKKKKGLFGRRDKKKDTLEDGFGASDQPSDWLGVDTAYDAREEGRKIGSWDNFPTGEDDFDDGFSWKGGAAEGDLIEDEEYAATQAARIRRKVSEMLVTHIGSKELWFVATSAHYVHSCGMRTFLEEYREDLRGALIINLDALGSGDLYWSVMEQAGKTYKSSARLTASARRVAREKNIRAKPYKKGKLRTEAGWALADGRKAVSIMRLTEAGVPFAVGSSQDVSRRLSIEKIDEAVEFVVSLIQEL